jgi:Bacteriocin-protection, YdeI or OmpD-Associated
MAKALETDPIGEAQAAWRALTQGQRREFLRWCQEWQNERSRKRAPVAPVERDFAAVLSKMDVGEPG